MIRPSVQTRHALARLTLPATVAASFGLMLVGKVDTVLVERARTAVYDASAPIYARHKGQIALDERGLVGRITEVGSRTARVLLITDMNSRVPVILEGSRSRAILAGTNGPLPRLLYWSEGTVPKQGERVVTSA